MPLLISCTTFFSSSLTGFWFVMRYELRAYTQKQIWPRKQISPHTKVEFDALSKHIDTDFGCLLSIYLYLYIYITYNMIHNTQHIYSYVSIITHKKKAKEQEWIMSTLTIFSNLHKKPTNLSANLLLFAVHLRFRLYWIGQEYVQFLLLLFLFVSENKLGR